MEISADSCSGHAVEKHQTERDLPRKCNDDEGGEDESAAAAQFADDDWFNCNICLVVVVEPVVTLCGHLYCWPCIYRWMQVEGAAARQCPVCKSPLSQNTLVPLYGRGDLRSGSTKEADTEIPRRSSLPHHAIIESVLAPRSAPGNQERRGAHPIHHDPVLPPLLHHRHQHGDYYTGDVPTSPIFRSTAGGVLGDLATAILPWTSSGHEAASVLLASPRVVGRRQLQMESCLNQLWLFLFCLVLLCLLFF